MKAVAVLLLSFIVYTTGVPISIYPQQGSNMDIVNDPESIQRFDRKRKWTDDESIAHIGSKFDQPWGLQSILVEGASSVSVETNAEKVDSNMENGKEWVPYKMAKRVLNQGGEAGNNFIASLTDSGSVRVPAKSVETNNQWKDISLSIKPVWDIKVPARSHEITASNYNYDDDEDDVDSDNTQTLFDKAMSMLNYMKDFQSNIMGLAQTVLQVVTNLPSGAAKITKFSYNLLSNAVRSMISIASAVGIFSSHTGYLLISAFAGEGEMFDIDTLDIRGNSLVVEKFKDTLKTLIALKETGIQEVYLLGGLGAAIMNLLADKAIVGVNKVSPILKALGLTKMSASLDLAARAVVYLQDQMSVKLLGHLVAHTGTNRVPQVTGVAKQGITPRSLW